MNEDFVNIFWGSSRNWTIFGGYCYVFYGLSLRSRYRIIDIFGLPKFQIFLGVLCSMKFLIFFGGER